MAPRHILPMVGTPHPAGADRDQLPLEGPPGLPGPSIPETRPGHLPRSRRAAEVPRGTVLRASVAGEHSVALQEEAGLGSADLVTEVEGRALLDAAGQPPGASHMCGWGAL